MSKFNIKSEHIFILYIEAIFRRNVAGQYSDAGAVRQASW